MDPRGYYVAMKGQWKLHTCVRMGAFNEASSTYAQVLAAVLNFLHQDWGSYMRGGWVLRKAWKVYQKTYRQVRRTT